MKWISVKDRLPEIATGVIILKDDYVTMGEWDGSGWSFLWVLGTYDNTGHCDPGHVKFWMPLPEPPKE